MLRKDQGSDEWAPKWRGFPAARPVQNPPCAKDSRARVLSHRLAFPPCDCEFEPGGCGPQIPARFPDPSCQRRLPRWFSCYFFTVNNFPSPDSHAWKSSATSDRRNGNTIRQPPQRFTGRTAETRDSLDRCGEPLTCRVNYYIRSVHSYLARTRIPERINSSSLPSLS